MSLGGRIVAAALEVLFALIVAVIAMPVFWFISRVLGLIPVMVAVSGGLTRLMLAGGVLFGAIAGALSVMAALRAVDETDRLGAVLGAIGGAIGGLCSSVMLFPIVVVL